MRCPRHVPAGRRSRTQPRSSAGSGVGRWRCRCGGTRCRCGADGIAGFGRGRLEDPQAKRGHLDAVESDGFHVIDPDGVIWRCSRPGLLAIVSEDLGGRRGKNADSVSCRGAGTAEVGCAGAAHPGSAGRRQPSRRPPAGVCEEAGLPTGKPAEPRRRSRRSRMAARLMREPLGPADSVGAPVNLALLSDALGGTTQV